MLFLSRLGLGIITLALLFGGMISSAYGFDPFGLGQASEAIAGATWKVVAIRAIESGKLVILLGLDLWALTWVTGKLGELMKIAAQDNKISGTEKVMLAIYSAAVVSVASIALPLGYALLGVMFS